MASCCHHLVHSTTTIEVGDDIVAVTFFATKPQNKVTAIFVVFFCIKAIKKTDRIYCRVFLILKHREEGNGNKLMSPLLLQHHHKRRQRRRRRHQLLLSPFSFPQDPPQKKVMTIIIFAFFFFVTPPQKKMTMHYHCFFFQTQKRR